jgi:hypothetical protein
MAVLLFLLTAVSINAQTIEQTLTTVLAKPNSVQEKIYQVHDLLQAASDKRTALKAEGAIGKGKLDDINAQTANIDCILRQRTEKRIELDQWREIENRGYIFFGPKPRPEGFVGDPPGKQRFEVLFGLDMSSGNILGLHIKMNDGTKEEM